MSFDAKQCDCGCAKTSDFVTVAEVALYSEAKGGWSSEDTRNLAHARAVNKRAGTAK